jgi:drug/metabolite transporter (DMT)-like permease
MFGAISLILLKSVRQHNDTETILLIVFGMGTILLYSVFRHHFFLPDLTQLVYLVSGGATAILGQYLLTMGFRYVTAVEGGILMIIRILLAALLGPYITSDPALTFSGLIGALLILGTNIFFILRRSHSTIESSGHKKFSSPGGRG